jgi:hypothetical protein
MTKTISLDDLTMLEVSVMDAEDLTTLLQTIAGRLLEVGRATAKIEPEWRTLKAESAYLAQVRSAVQSALRTVRVALGE